MKNKRDEELWGDLLEFKGQESGEEVLLVIRPHVVVFAKVAVVLVLGLIILFLLLKWFGMSGPTSYFLLLFIAVMFYMWSLQFYRFTNTVALLTDRRLVSVLQLGFFKRRVVETNLANIQTAHYEQNGFLETIFAVGSMIIETSDGSKVFTLPLIGHPYDVQQNIIKAQRQLNKD